MPKSILNVITISSVSLIASASLAQDPRPNPFMVQGMAVANCLEESPHVGIAAGRDANAANRNAIAACIRADGTQDCCKIYATVIHGASGQRTICLAGAQGSNGDFGWGTGADQNDAVSAAINNCKINAVAPAYCVRQGDVVCQTDPSD
jgi:hypothetical protein